MLALDCELHAIADSLAASFAANTEYFNAIIEYFLAGTIFHFHDRMHFNEGYDGNPGRAKLIMSLAWRLSFVARCLAMPFGFSGAFVLLTTETSRRFPKM